MRKSRIYAYQLLVLFVFAFNTPLIIQSVNAATWIEIEDAEDDVYRYVPNTSNPNECEMTANPDTDLIHIKWTYDETEGLVFNFTFKGEYNLSEMDVYLFVDMNGTYSDSSEYPSSKDYEDIDYDLRIEMSRYFDLWFFNFSAKPAITPIEHTDDTFEIRLGSENNHMIDWIPNLQSPESWNIFGYTYYQNWVNNYYDYINWENFKDAMVSKCPSSGFPYWIIAVIAGGVAAAVIVVIVLKKRQKPASKSR